VKVGNIVLIGFHGSEKTSIGKEISERLKWAFYDTDAIIEKREGKKLQEICELYGENYYLKREEEIMAEVTQLEDAIIAMGDASPLDLKHFEKLREKGTVVYLKAPLEGLDPGGLRCARRYGSELMMSLSSLDEIYHEEADVVIEPPGVDFTLETLKKMAVFK